MQVDVNSRKQGSAPELGRVAKMPGYGRRVGRRSRRQSDSPMEQLQRERQAAIVRWSIVIGVVSMAALVVAFSFWLMPKLQQSAHAAQSAPGSMDSRTSRFKSPTEQEALTLVRKALALRDPDAVDGLIRRGEATALEVVDFLKELKATDGEIAECAWLGTLDKNSLALEGVRIVSVSKDKPKTRMALLTPDANGIWKLDFAAFARAVKPSWSDLLEKKAESAVVRVYVTKEHYFNGPFADDRKWVAYKLSTPDIDEVLVGYCKVGSDQHRAMELMWQRGDVSISRATLEIRHVVGSDRWQFEIAKVLAEDWVTDDKPLDKSLQ